MDDKTKDKLNALVMKFLKDIIRTADEENYDRDSFVKASADMIQLMAEISTFEHFQFENSNADRIRAMSDEELEDFIRKIAIQWEPWCDNHCKMDGDDDCNKCLTKWLQQPAEEASDHA